MPALILDASHHPRLRELVKGTCNCLGTDFPDVTLLSSESHFWVAHGKFKTFSGLVGGRVLCLSMPLLTLLSVTDLRAILAHEFAHFTQEDTVWTARVYPVYVGIATAPGLMSAIGNEQSSDESSTAAFANIPLIFPRLMLTGYLKRFHEINMSLSRVREFRADAIATHLVGTRAFGSAVVKVSALGILFERTYLKTANELATKGQYLRNGYQYFQASVLTNQELYAEVVSSLLTARKEEDASHPSLAERLTSIPRVDLEDLPDCRCAADLLDKRAEMEDLLALLYAATLSARLGTLKL